MAQYVDKDALENILRGLWKEDDGKNSEHRICYNKALQDVQCEVDTLEGKEVDLELITGWFDHIAQIADDRMTLTNQRMTDAHALDEIKCLAKNSSDFITRHYKAQKGEEVW